MDRRWISCYGTRVRCIDYSNDSPNTVFRGNLTYSASSGQEPDQATLDMLMVEDIHLVVPDSQQQIVLIL